MKARKQQTEYRVGVGASSVLLILVVLAMAALALLSFGSARNTEALTNRNIEMTQAFYEASAEVQRRLAAIDQAVLEYREQSSDVQMDENWFSAYGTQAEWQQADDGMHFTIIVPAGAQRVVRATGTAFPTGDERYTLLSHTLFSDSVQEETYLTLMGSE